MSVRTCVYVCGPIQRSDTSLEWQNKYKFQRSDKTTEELPIPVSSQLHKVDNMDDDYKNKIITAVLNTEHKRPLHQTPLSWIPSPQDPNSSNPPTLLLHEFVSCKSHEVAVEVTLILLYVCFCNIKW